jgi:hypothetical protein
VKTILIIACLIVFAASSMAQSRTPGLPAGALVIERRRLPVPNRSLVLWMLNPKKNPSDYGSDEPIPCPGQTRGSYYSGPTRVSLLNSATNTIINTLKIVKEYEDGEDSFDVPYAIRRGFYYHVAIPVKGTAEARPTIMWLQDYNGDGKALEFVFFDALACMGLETTLLGYSQRQDEVIRYPVHLDVVEGSKRSTSDSFWADYLFNKKPVRPGFWKYEVDYRGRAGALDKWEVRYNAATETFEGKLIVVPGD